jgi:hypothetical protein
VTLSEALGELGVEAGAEAETIRRAYLRLIKTRKPETDPAGFQRARQAYELARAAAELETLATESDRQHAPPDGGVNAPSSTTSGAPPSAAPGAGDIVFQGFLTAWRAIPASADQRPRLEVAREVVAVLPKDPRAHWLLARTLSGWGNDGLLADALRAGWQQGWPEFLEALLLRLPGRVSRQEVDAAFASDRLSLRLAGAVAAARWGDGSDSAARVVEICAAAAKDGASTPDEPLVGRMIDVVLALHEAGAQTAARTAHEAIATWLHDSGLELTLARGPLGGVWTLAEELARLPPGFPESLRRPFAAATRAGDLQIALADACSRAHSHAGEVRSWAARVRPTAPNVANILDAAVRHAGAQRRAVRTFNFRYLAWFAIPLCSWIIRSCNEPSSPSLESVRPYPSVIASLPVRAVPRPAPGLEMAHESADELCGAGGPRHGQLVCADVEALLGALDDGDCEESTERLHDLRDKLPHKARGELEDRVLTRLTLARWQMCDAAAPPPDQAAAP